MGRPRADSSSLNEKNHQVEMMNIIYGNASRVCIWLGEATESSRLALSFIKNEVLHLQSFDTLCDSKYTSDKWMALLDLMQRLWFSRRWVVQELALAQKPIIYCGNDRISWKKFAIAVELFVEVETATHRLSEVMKKKQQNEYIPAYFDYVSALGASLLVDATERLFRDWKKVELSKTFTKAQHESMIDSYSDCESTKSDDSDSALAPTMRDSPNVMNDSRSRIQSLLSLEYLVSSLTIFETTVPHDTIYALLAIAKDTTPRAVSARPAVSSRSAQENLEVYTQRKSYNVDYKLPYVGVCKEFIQFAIERSLDGNSSRALDVICRPWAIEERKLKKNREAKERQHKNARKAKREEMKLMERLHTPSTFRYYPRSGVTRSADTASAEDPIAMEAAAEFKRQDIELPSWIPQLSNAPFAMGQRPGMDGPKMSRINADPLVGLPSSTHQNYSAAETKGVDMKALRFRKRLVTKQFSMYVRGFQFDIVEEVAEVARNGHIPMEWAGLAGWDAEGDPPEPFWRTLVANRGKGGKNPPVYYSRACQESFRKGGFESGAIDTPALIEYERNSVVAQFCRRVQAVTWNRALIRTEGEKLGIVGKDVQKGDSICILYGCSVPVILRESPRKTEKEFEVELEQELMDVNNVVVKTVREYIKRKRQHQIWKDKEMAKLCRMWLETTGYIRRHGSDPGYFPITESQSMDRVDSRAERVKSLRSSILKKIIADFETWCFEERKKAWLITKSDIEAEMKQRKENPKKKPIRTGKREMDAHIRRLADQAAEIRTSRKRVQLQPVTDIPGVASETSVLKRGADPGVIEETPAVPKKKKPSSDWWEFEYALVAGRRWKQVVRQSKEDREAKWRLHLLENYRVLESKNTAKEIEDPAGVPTTEGPAVEGRDIAREDDGVSMEHITEGSNRQDETAVIDAENDNGAPLGNQEHDQAMGEEESNSGDHETRDEHPKDDDRLPVDASSSNSTISDAHAPKKIRPSWHRKIERTKLPPDEIKTYKQKVRNNLRERLGEEGYYSYTLLGECYIHGMMDGEAMQYLNEDAEGPIPSMVYEIR